MNRYSMLINGKSADSDQTFDVINPATGLAFAQCALGTPALLDQAVEAARAAFPAWSALSNDDRKSTLLALADLIEANKDELIELVTLESGKPKGGLNGVGATKEILGTIGWARATSSFKLPTELLQDNDDSRIEIHRKPLGVVASITPWNWPLMIAMWHCAPALLTGNTVVIKPSSNTPLSTIRLVELANQVLPAGVFNLVTGDAEIGSAISQHSDIDKIVFTGSTRTGKSIMSAAAGNLKKLTLELGGNDAGIVLPDVNVEEIVPQLFGAAFHNNGQTCACLKRLYVHESQYDEISQGLAKLANETVIGDGLQESSQLGPVQNANQLNVVMSLADSARSAGGEFLSGGEAKSGGGYFYPPTIVTGLSDGDRLVDEEQFGPILPVVKYTDIEEVLARSNNNENGLGGSAWSSDTAKATDIALRMQCGTAWVNEHGNLQPNAPFGGVKQSGIGVEFGQHGLAEYTSLQTIKIAK